VDVLKSDSRNDEDKEDDLAFTDSHGDKIGTSED
jgi:hypothetical protein